MLVSLTVMVLFAASLQARIEPLPGVDSVCTTGAAKGIMTDSATAEAMDREFRVLEPLREIKEGNVLYFSPWSNYRYMEDEKDCASFSMWFRTHSEERNLENMEKLRIYWSLFPEKRPDYIYLPEKLLEDKVFLEQFEDYKFRTMPLEEGVVFCMDWS